MSTELEENLNLAICVFGILPEVNMKKKKKKKPIATVLCAPNEDVLAAAIGALIRQRMEEQNYKPEYIEDLEIEKLSYRQSLVIVNIISGTSK